MPKIGLFIKKEGIKMMKEVKKNENYSFSAEELLQHIQEQCNINMDTVLNDMNNKKMQEILSQHKSKIYQQKDGRWCTYIKENGNRKAIRVSSQSELEKRLYNFYLEQDTESQLKNATLETLFDEWIQYKNVHVKKQTIAVFKSTWNKHYKDSDIVKKPIKSITKLYLDEWIHKVIQEYSMNKSQYTNFVSIVKQILNYAVDKDIISENPYMSVRVDTRRVLTPRQKRADHEQVFYPEEEARFEMLAIDDFNRKLHPVNQLVSLAGIFLFYTGLRVGELCALKYSDILGNYIRVQRFYNNSIKAVEQGLKAGHSYRDVPLPTRAVELIELTKMHKQNENCFDENGYIFSMTECPASYDAVRSLFYQYCKQLETYPKGPHCARKTFISRLIDAGVNINTIRKIVGHNDERTTLNNYCYDRHSESDIYNTICKSFS